MNAIMERDEWEQMIEIANKRLDKKVSTKEELIKQVAIESGILGCYDFLGIDKKDFYDALEKCGHKFDYSKVQWKFLLEKKGIKCSLKDYFKKQIKENGSTRDLAEEFGCTQAAIRYKLNKYGIETPKHGGSRWSKTKGKIGKKKEAFLNIPKDEIKHMNIKEIAERIECCYQYAWMLVKEYQEEFEIGIGLKKGRNCNEPV